MPWHSPWQMPLNCYNTSDMGNAIALLQHRCHGKCRGIVTTQVPWQKWELCCSTRAMATWQMGNKNYLLHVPQMGHKLGTNFGYWINTEKHKNNLLNFVFGKVYVLQMGYKNYVPQMGYTFGVQYRVQGWIWYLKINVLRVLSGENQKGKLKGVPFRT